MHDSKTNASNNCVGTIFHLNKTQAHNDYGNGRMEKLFPLLLGALNVTSK